MNNSIAALLLALALPSPLAFAAPATPPDKAPPQLTLYHWWTSPSEVAALNALTKVFSEKYPDVVVTALVIPGGRNVRTSFLAVQRHSLGPNPPDVFQMFAGYAAQVFFDGDLTSPVDDLWKQEKLESVIPPVIRDMNQFDGHYYSIPINVHRTNLVWYNKALLAKHHIDPASLTTWDAFFKAAATLKAEGVASPIQLGVDWTAKAAFEGMMASQGIGAYEDWINGKITSPADARLLKALEIFRKYVAFANKDHASIEWDVALRRVMKSESAFSTMGDWANGEFRIAKLTYGHDYGALPVPGTKGMFGVGVDTFQHPRGLVDETIAMRWLVLAASREGQDAFNPLKGSVSARTDADVTRYDSYQQTAIADLKSSVLYPTLGAAVPPAYDNLVDHTLGTLAVDGDIAKAASAIAGMATKLAGQYKRTWHLRP